MTTGPGIHTRHRLLVIGYGNELRGDDGVGPKVAETVADWNLDGVASLPCHQLTPELAELISATKHVIFVDATVDPQAAVRTRDIEPMAVGQIMTHSADPRALLKLAKQIFGHCPDAQWITIPIQNLAFGEDLSPLARQGMQAALETIRKFAAAE